MYSVLPLAAIVQLQGGTQPKDDRAETWREPESLMALLVPGTASAEAHPTSEVPFM